MTSRSQILKITMIGYVEVNLHHLKPQTLKHVKIRKFSDKRICDTSLESSRLGDHRF